MSSRRGDGPQILLLLSGAFGPAGGLEMYCRLVIKSFSGFAQENSGVCDVFVLNDRELDIDKRYVSGEASNIRAFSRSRIRFVLSTIAYLITNRPDVVIFGHITFAPLVLLVQRLRPSVPRWLLTYGVEVWRELTPLRARVLAGMSVVVTISEYTRQQILGKGIVPAENVFLLPCAVDPFWTDQFPPYNVEAAQPTLLTVARLAAAERAKGVDEILHALPSVRRRIANVRYVIIGDGPDRARLERVAASLDLQGVVEFRGRVSNRDLAKAYAECSLFVMPSQKEGFGIVFLEAAHYSKPSLAGAYGGSPEVVLDDVTGRLVVADSATIADVLIELLSQPDLLERMGKAAQHRLQRFFLFGSFDHKATELLASSLQRQSPRQSFAS